MLKNPYPGRASRFAGCALIAGLTGAGSSAAWAAHPGVDASALILVNLKMTIFNLQWQEVKAQKTQYLVHSGETIKDANGRPLDFVCTPYLADESGKSTDRSDQEARGVPLPAAGQILLDCTIRRDGEIVQRPVLISKDGERATIETSQSGGRFRYRFDVTASTSPEKIAAAEKQPFK